MHVYDTYFVIKYIEPLEINEASVGLNIAFEKNRRDAANQARETGKATITKRIFLVQDNEKTPGFLLLNPTYEDDLPLNNAEQRKKAFLRWIYAPFIGKNFMANLTNSQGELFHLQVYDEGIKDKEKLIYNSQLSANAHSPEFTLQRKISIMGQEWLLVWESTEAFEALENTNEPLFLLIIGLLFTGILAVLLIISGIQRSQSGLVTHSLLIPLAAFIVTVASGYFLKQAILENENNFIKTYVTEATSITAITIQKNVNSRILALSRMADRWSISGGTPFNQWQNDAKNYVKDQPGLTAVEWVDETYHVRWVEPLEGNENAVGLNILFDKKREDALVGAAEKKSVTLTPPIDLVQGYKAFISYSPIHINGKHKGYIAGLFDINTLLDSSFINTDKQNFYFELSHNGEIFYHSANTQPALDDTFSSTIELPLYDKNWVLTLKPTKSFVKSQETFLPNLILITSVILATLIALIINFSQRSRLKSLLIAEKEALLSTFVKHAPAAVAMFDTELNYIAASDRWQKDYNLKDKKIIGKNHYDLFPEILRNHPEWSDRYKRAIGGEVISVDEEMFIRDNTESWLRYELRPWETINQHIGGIIMFTEDITERKRADVLKDEFISTVSHELRTPMTSIRTALELLEFKAKDSLDEKNLKFLNMAHKNCIQLAGLVDDILDVQKIASGKMTYHIEETEMCRLIQEVVNQYHFYAEKYKVTFNVSTTLKKVICEIDKGRFNQVLANLLSNAAKFSAQGEVVTIKISKKDAKTLEVAVQDKGAGIPKDFQSKVFDKFLQADSSSTRAKGGTGLGLNITKSIIEAFGGKISFKSKEGKGTTFFLHLPIKMKK